VDAHYQKSKKKYYKENLVRKELEDKEKLGGRSLKESARKRKCCKKKKHR